MRKLPILLVCLLVSICAYLLGNNSNTRRSWRIFSIVDEWMIVFVWSIAQWIPIVTVSNLLQEYAWKQWELGKNNEEFTNTQQPFNLLLEIPTISVQDHNTEDILMYLENTYGMSWRDHPVLFRGLWTTKDLSSSSSSKDNKNDHVKERKLSLSNLLNETMTIPYFTDARNTTAYTPDGKAPMNEILYNISIGKPHKIATQLLVQQYPTIINEIAPLDVMTQLFGNYFQIHNILGVAGTKKKKKNTLGIFPATTTVPIFIANSGGGGRQQQQQKSDASTSTNIATTTEEETFQSSSISSNPFTGLHCEPIGNIAVQLSGSKHWTLIHPQYSNLLVPSLSPDGRAYFASWRRNLDTIPKYQVITYPGDAIWVPTWTWHKVEYYTSIESTTTTTNSSSGNNNEEIHPEKDDINSSISIGGSLFHFRCLDFFRQNPLYALLILPALMKESIGVSTQ